MFTLPGERRPRLHETSLFRRRSNPAEEIIQFSDGGASIRGIVPAFHQHRLHAYSRGTHAVPSRVVPDVETIRNRYTYLSQREIEDSLVGLAPTHVATEDDMIETRVETQAVELFPPQLSGASPRCVRDDARGDSTSP